MPYEIAMGPRERKSPFFDSTVADGATHMTIYNQMYMPVSYGDTVAEYNRLLEGVSMWQWLCENAPIGLESWRLLWRSG